MAVRTYNNLRNPSTAELVWPSNITEGFDYLQIDIKKFIPSSTFGASRSNQINLNSAPAPVATPLSSLGSIVSTFLNFGSTFGGASSTATIDLESIILPIPEQIAYSDAPKWSEQDLGTLGKFAPALAKSVAAGDTESITTNIQKLAEAGKVDVLMNLIGKFGADPNAITQNLEGKIRNPYTEQVFGGIGLRNFDFSWKLVPRNEKEQLSIHRIIKILRSRSLPNITNQWSSTSNTGIDQELNRDQTIGNAPVVDRWLTVPDIFNLRWMYQGSQIDSLPRIKPCVLKSINVNYTPDNVWASHLTSAKVPYPVAYSLSMSFGETEIITGNEVADGGY